jgi:uncharacterized protein YukE
MSGDQYARYAQLSHEELYRTLMASDPGQVEHLASQWRSLQETLDHLATSLDTTLNQLSQAWESDSSAVYQYYMATISSFATALSTEFDQLHEGLKLMAIDLRAARAKAESPADTDNSDKAISGAAKGAAIGGAVAGPGGAVVGGAIGAAFGHQQDEEEQAKAHQRMVRVVADLAERYEVSAVNRWPVEPVEPPTGLPGDKSGGAATPSRGPAVGAPAAAPHLGPGGGRASRTVADPGPGRAAPADGSAAGGTHGAGDGPAVEPPSISGTALLGAGGALVGSAVLNAAALDAVLGAGAAGLRGVPGAGEFGTGAAGKVTGGAAGATANGLRGGVIGGHADGHGMADGRSASGTGRSGSVNSAGRGTDQDADHDERMTWLTEDEMVWGDDESSAPAVIGGEPAPEPRPE